jgi:hypothetical protein
LGATIALPNVLPLPGFLVAALMEASASDGAGVLCLTAIDAIGKRVRADGQDPVESPAAQKSAYVPIWIRNHATQRAAVSQGSAKGVGSGIAVSRRADRWASSVQRRYLFQTISTTARMSPPASEVDAVGAKVWTKLANTLAIQPLTVAIWFLLCSSDSILHWCDHERSPRGVPLVPLWPSVARQEVACWRDGWRRCCGRPYGDAGDGARFDDMLVGQEGHQKAYTRAPCGVARLSGPCRIIWKYGRRDGIDFRAGGANHVDVWSVGSDTRTRQLQPEFELEEAARKR